MLSEIVDDAGLVEQDWEHRGSEASVLKVQARLCTSGSSDRFCTEPSDSGLAFCTLSGDGTVFTVQAVAETIQS